MSARDFYESIGENYGETFSRFGSEALIEKLVAAYAQDRTFESLERAIENGDVKSAFVSAHTLKGVAANLGFSNLAKVASEITEILRRGSLDGVAPLLAQARDIQNAIIANTQIV